MSNFSNISNACEFYFYILDDIICIAAETSFTSAVKNNQLIYIFIQGY